MQESSFSEVWDDQGSARPQPVAGSVSLQHKQASKYSSG